MNSLQTNGWKHHVLYLLLAISVLLGGFLGLSRTVDASILSLSPTSGTYAVGSTFDVSIFLNTEDESINALALDLQFPPDKLQLVSPKTSLSVIEIWTSQPKFNNQTGIIHLEGGIPNGINVQRAQIATLTFRVRAVGSGVISFKDASKVLLNDGYGTDSLKQKIDGVYTFILPPPQGPIVASETHPEQGIWYQGKDVVLNWSGHSSATAYSYVLDRNPTTIPDDIAEGDQENVSYTSQSDGQHYFHIKARNNNAWGGVTHFAIGIDSTPPAEFQLDFIPSQRTSSEQPIVKFATTDRHSGISHYEFRAIPLFTRNAFEGQEEIFFIETQSPHVIANVSPGAYDVTIRAYDKSGNYQETVERLSIVKGFLTVAVKEGLIIRGFITISWFWLIMFNLLLAYLLWRYTHRIKKKHEDIHEHLVTKVIPDKVKSKLDELKKYKKKYGKLKSLVLYLAVGAMMMLGSPALAQNNELAPPIIDSLSRTISNEEIFYIGGNTRQFVNVIVYSQNTRTGETQANTVQASESGEWFYRHDTFLSPGRYIVWTQSQLGDIFSPPSAQVEILVEETAFELGSTRISYAIAGLFVTILLFVVVIVFSLYLIIHLRKLRQRNKRFLKEIHEAEESVRRGFAVLRHDLQERLATIKKSPKSSASYREAKELEDQLLKDLSEIELQIGKEIWDIEDEVNDTL